VTIEIGWLAGRDLHCASHAPVPSVDPSSTTMIGMFNTSDRRQISGSVRQLLYVGMMIAGLKSP
jgi:hypothetical protein